MTDWLIAGFGAVSTAAIVLLPEGEQGTYRTLLLIASILGAFVWLTAYARGGALPPHAGPFGLALIVMQLMRRFAVLPADHTKCWTVVCFWLGPPGLLVLPLASITGRLWLHVRQRDEGEPSIFAVSLVLSTTAVALFAPSLFG